MKILRIIVFLSFAFNLNTLSQSIYLDNYKFALDFGVGYSINFFDKSESDFDNIIYNVSGSIFGIIDIGYQYSTIVGNGKNKSPSSYSFDMHISKDPIGFAVNSAFSNSNLLLGISFYKIFKGSDTFFADKTIPIVSVGTILPDQLTAFSFGFSFQNDINEHIKIAFTPGINSAENITQIFLLLS